MDAILGYIVALTLSMLGVAGFTTWARLGVANVQTAATAGQMLTFDKAAQQYVQDNGSTIAALATATAPVTITPAMLIAAGYLPNGFSPTNVFGQTWQLQVLQPSAGQLQSLVTSQGGTPISNTRQLVQIAAQAGAQGGFVPYANQAGDASMSPTTANGAYGGWKLPLANYTNPGSGHLASLLAFTNMQSSNAYLYRVAVPGHPELNTMQTALNMGTHDVDNAANVNATGVDVQNPNGTPTVMVGNTKLTSVGSQAILQADGGTVLTTSAGSSAPLSAGDISSDGTVAGNYIQPNGIVAAGQACAPNGTMAKSGTGPIFCKSGVWQPALFNTIPDTQVLQWLETWGVETTRYCPPGYAAMSATSIVVPSGTYSCLSTVFNNPASQQSGDVFAGCTSHMSGDTGYMNQLVCARFQ
ncbi:shufflon system plasmid conjugative transfer pilus tip adhesin PilV [Trinickia fusca]|uniref:Shufflon system plasmid conjugative transfer pilus tip adhesin PilV n=2 Tax=Trinickia fusca TaxID=2419777 RepID=A0A494X9V7_9BURK|nr:shufflon system plasmid conjugative transfer pilus tip adhesin PilV [Trinickia fusca]